MKLTKTLSAIILILALSVTALVSCEGGVPSVTSPLDAADAVLASSAYTARVTMMYSSTDAEMADAINALGASSITLATDGTSEQLTLRTEAGGLDIVKSYISTGGTLYHESTATLGENTVSVKEQAPLAADSRLMLTLKLGGAAVINTSDFTTYEVKLGELSTTVSCTDMKTETKSSLAAVLGASLSAIDATLVIDSARLAATLTDGKYRQTTLTINMTVTLGENSYPLTLTSVTDYDYVATVTITAPADTDAYTVKTYDEIVK